MTTQEDPEAPASGEGGNRRRGVRPETPLTRSAIVQAAIKLLDEEGSDAFGIRSIARALNVYPTAIYHHIHSLRHLRELVSVAWMGEAFPASDLESPLVWLENVAHAYRDAAHRHPNVARLVATDLVSAPEGFVLPEIVIAHLAATGLPDDELAPMYNTVLASIVGFVDIELDRLPYESDADRRAAAAAVRSLDPELYPTLHKHLDSFANRAFALRWQSGEELPMDSSFAYLVDVLLSAVRARAERANSGA